jgi:hypothetical protein
MCVLPTSKDKTTEGEKEEEKDKIKAERDTPD